MWTLIEVTDMVYVVKVEQHERCIFADKDDLLLYLDPLLEIGTAKAGLDDYRL